MSDGHPFNLPLKVRWRLARRNVEHRLRNRFLDLLRWMFRTSDISSPQLSAFGFPKGVRRLLIVRTGRAIGDMVMSLVLIPECRRLFPDARVECLMRDSLLPFFKEGAGADEVLEFYPRFLQWPRATGRLLRALRSRRYDLVIACDNPCKSSMTTLCFCRWTGAAVRVGFDNEESRPFLNLRVASARGEPMVRNLLRLLSPFGPEGQMNRALPRLTPSAAATEKARAILGSGVAPVIVFAASHWRKSWPLESFLRVATALTDRGHRVMLAFGPGDGRISDAAARAWERNSGGKGAVLPPQDPPCWLALLAGCRLFLSNDCGPYHLAVAAGASCVTAFVSQDALRDFSHVHEGRLAAFHEPRGEDAERKMIEKSLECLERAG